MLIILFIFTALYMGFAEEVEITIVGSGEMYMTYYFENYYKDGSKPESREFFEDFEVKPSLNKTFHIELDTEKWDYLNVSIYNGSVNELLIVYITVGEWSFKLKDRYKVKFSVYKFFEILKKQADR